MGLRFGRRSQALIARRMIAMRELDPLRRLVELIALLDILAHSRDATELSTAGFLPSLRVEDRQRIRSGLSVRQRQLHRRDRLGGGGGAGAHEPVDVQPVLSPDQRQAFYGLCERAADRLGLPAVDRDRPGNFANCTGGWFRQFVEFQSPVLGAEEDAAPRLSPAFSAGLAAGTA